MTAIRRKFVPARMFGGLALSLAGFAGLYAMFFTDLTDGRISIKLTLFLGILILGGFGFAFSAFARACARCNEELKEGALFAPLDWQGHIARVVSSGQPSALLSLGQAPMVHLGRGSVAMLSFDFCPRCMLVASGRAGARAYSDTDPNVWKDSALSEPATFVGPEVVQLVDLARNRGGVPG